jgi:hypothetical protein
VNQEAVDTFIQKSAAHLAGHPNPERDKYVRMWARPEYRENAPGEQSALEFLSVAKIPAHAECIDFGAGTGRGAWLLAALGKMRVTMLDIAPNCLDEEVAEYCKTQPDRIKFVEHDLTQTPQVTAAYGFCTDVMEHIPTDDVDRVLHNILASAQHVFFKIALHEEGYGNMIGEVLHLTVQPASMWRKRLTDAGAVIHWESRTDLEYTVYCTAWKEASDVVLGALNVPEQVAEAQARENISAGWQHVRPYNLQQRELILLGGGPSLNDHVDEIKKLRADGAALVTVNGAYAWAIERGMVPSAQVVLDARPFNQRFVLPIVDTCQYLIASQAHPSTLEPLPRERTYLWHCGLSDELAQFVIDKKGCYYPTPGGTTVVLRAIPLLRMLGFRQMHVFGLDSCLTDQDHHAYCQPENDGQIVVPVTCGGKVFQCHPWMVKQATEMVDMIRLLGDEVDLCVYGDGLIAKIIEVGAGAEISELLGEVATSEATN